jgi:O-antigen ligase
MFIPFVGPIFGLWVMYNTGIAIAAETIAASPQVSPLLTFLMLFIFPFTWMEFISYSTGFAESVWLIRRGMQGRGRREIKNAATLIAIVAVILLFAAIIEVALILALNG